MHNFFEIIIPTYNVERWIDITLDSCFSQDYPTDRFLVRIADANSTDNTFYKILNCCKYSTNLICYRHNRRVFPLENTKFLVNNCNAKSICVLVDGDDFLAHHTVLKKLNEVYNENVWMTCGSYIEYPVIYMPPPHTPFTKHEMDNNLYRESGKWPSHLRTFRKELFEKIPDEYFKDSSGNYYDVSGDIAYTYPMLEMAAERFHYITDPLYRYNKINPISDFATMPKKQEIVAETIKRKYKFNRLEKL